MHFTCRAASGIPVAACVIGITWAMAGCSQSSGLPVAPSALTPTTPRGAPIVTEAVPSMGSAEGGATVKIVGTGFMPGMVATFDGIRVTGRFDSRDISFSTFYTEAPAHAAGAVDLVVTNPDGQSQRLPGGYTYAPQESFDLNGVWGGFAFDAMHTAVEFVIQGNRLVSASCAHDNFPIPFTFSDFPTVEKGEFALIADGGATISGRIVSASEVVGIVSFAPACTSTPLPWRADRKNN